MANPERRRGRAVAAAAGLAEAHGQLMPADKLTRIADSKINQRAA